MTDYYNYNAGRKPAQAEVIEPDPSWDTTEAIAVDEHEWDDAPQELIAFVNRIQGGLI